jgi:hypothetical protein
MEQYRFAHLRPERHEQPAEISALDGPARGTNLMDKLGGQFYQTFNLAVLVPINTGSI